MLQGIYAITDPLQTSDAVIERKITAALQGGVELIALRDDAKSDEELTALIKRLRPLFDRFQSRLLLFNRPSLAAALPEVDGLHMDDPDADANALRSLMGHKLLGISCGGDLEYARACESAGADFVVLGAFWYSFTEPNRPLIEQSRIDEAKALLSIPVVAMGGIDVDNAAVIAAHRPHMIGLISGLWLTPNPGTTARKILAHLHA